MWFQLSFSRAVRFGVINVGRVCVIVPNDLHRASQNCSIPYRHPSQTQSSAQVGARRIANSSSSAEMDDVGSANRLLHNLATRPRAMPAFAGVLQARVVCLREPHLNVFQGLHDEFRGIGSDGDSLLANCD